MGRSYVILISTEGGSYRSASMVTVESVHTALVELSTHSGVGLLIAKDLALLRCPLSGISTLGDHVAAPEQSLLVGLIELLGGWAGGHSGVGNAAATVWASDLTPNRHTLHIDPRPGRSS